MRRTAFFTLLCLTVTALAVGEDTAEAPATEVKIGAATLRFPAAWKKKNHPSRMRVGTFSIPAAEGDAEGGELAIFDFGGGGGGIDANLQRWIGQFSGDKRTVKVTKGKTDGGEYYIADVAGTYNKSVGPPILRKTKPAPGYRMYAVILVLKGEGVYFLKLTGPDATVKAQAETFRQSFGGDSKSESDYEI